MKVSDKEWKETRNGNAFATYSFVEQYDDKVILLASEKNLFYTIDSKSVKFGPTREKAEMNHLSDGEWIEKKTFNPTSN